MCGNQAKLKLKKEKEKENNGTFKESVGTPDTSTYVKNRTVLQGSQLVPLFKYQFYFLRKIQWDVSTTFALGNTLWDMFLRNVSRNSEKKNFLIKYEYSKSDHV